MKFSCAWFLFFTVNIFPAVSQAAYKPYADTTHYSKVFGEIRNYRIYLPAGYHSSRRNYPVIYFFHGWGGRHNQEPSANINYEKIDRFVDRNQVILAMWDGRIEAQEPRPYNIGEHEDVKYQVQMKDYFPEFINHIDSNYRTIKQRSARGIIGFSMGGFMAMYQAGKYPDKVSAIVDFTGSPEFFIGYPESHTLYPVRYTLENLRDIQIMLVNRKLCPLYGLNKEIDRAASWMRHEAFTYVELPGEHRMDTLNETDNFEMAMKFILNSFKNPLAQQPKWSHYDIYSQFEKNGYVVRSNKDQPGYLYLSDVTKNGFGFYTKKWLPEGPLIEDIEITIQTPPIYTPNSIHNIKMYYSQQEKVVYETIKADSSGRLHLSLTGKGVEIGITEVNKNENGFAVASFKFQNDQKFLRVNKHSNLRVNIFNQGTKLDTFQHVALKLISHDTKVIVHNPQQNILVNQSTDILESGFFTITSTKTPPKDGSPWSVCLSLEIKVNDSIFTDDIIIPMWYDVPQFEDAKIFVVTDENYNKPYSELIECNQRKVEKVSPSDQIVVFINGRRLKLYAQDPFVLSKEEKIIDDMLPAYWPDGFTLTSAIKIAGDLPFRHTIELLGYYETKTHFPIFRKVYWGTVELSVTDQ